MIPLDNESEYAVAKSLNELAKGRTTLTIAHRLSSIRNSDRILVLTEEGDCRGGKSREIDGAGRDLSSFLYDDERD